MSKISVEMNEDVMTNDLQTKNAILEGLYQCAERRDINALKILGGLYSTGLGVEQSTEAAFLYYYEASELGDPQAQYSLALMYLNPDKPVDILPSTNPTFEVDTETGSIVYLDAKTQRRRESPNKNPTLRGVILASKQKYMENKRKAVSWLQKASDQNDPRAHVLLAAFYLDGSGGVEVNILKAKDLLEKAILMENVDAYYNLASVYFSGLKGKSNGEMVEIKPNVEKAIWLFHKAVSMGDASSSYWLGHVYHQGELLPKQVEIAIQFLNLAIKQGHPGAMWYMACMYKNGDGIEKDETKWKYYLEQCLERNHPDALYFMGDCYYHGNEQNKDWIQAHNYYEKAGNLGHKDALYCLGTMYYHGYGVEQDFKLAFEKYQVAATLGSKGAMAAMIPMLTKGLGCQADLKQAQSLIDLLN